MKVRIKDDYVIQQDFLNKLTAPNPDHIYEVVCITKRDDGRNVFLCHGMRDANPNFREDHIWYVNPDLTDRYPRHNSGKQWTSDAYDKVDRSCRWIDEVRVAEIIGANNEMFYHKLRSLEEEYK
jgi:hypothetical protein